MKEELNLKHLKSVGSLSGCINKGSVYDTDKGKIFVKCNSGSEADVMFKGEYQSLKELSQTKTVKVPEPLLIGEVDKKNFLVMEYLDLKNLNNYSSELGTLLAQLHLHNIRALNQQKETSNLIGKNNQAIDKFGFHITTACGYLPQNNEWCDDWVSFYTQQKLQYQINLIIREKENREIIELWSHLQQKIPIFFKDITVQPSLLHGDLWCGNAGETDFEPVIFDPASFYGHHEYDLAIAVMFGGFKNQFFKSYHALIKKTPGFNQRQELYLLFHHLNHWNHFGTHKNSSLQIMKSLIQQK